MYGGFFLFPKKFPLEGVRIIFSSLGRGGTKCRRRIFATAE
jgi:hypothetical protein